MTTTPSLARRIGLVVVFLFFLVGGVAHFVFASAEIGIIPTYVPYPVQVNELTGVCELLGAAGLLVRRFRRLAGYGLILLTIGVTLANVDMLQHAERFPAIPVWVLVIRLPLQVGLIALIYWSSGAVQRRAAPADSGQDDQAAE